jgi:hypothetical protein
MQQLVMTARDNIHADLLNHNNISTIKNIVVGNFDYLIHKTSFGNLFSIATNGLEPRSPNDCALDINQEILRNAFNNEIPPRLCLSIPNRSVPPSNQESGRIVTLAVGTSDLPEDIRFGIDWSFAGQWNLELNDNETSQSYFLKSVQNCGSIISYYTIPSRYLRIRCSHSLPCDPSSWPYLSRLDRCESVFLE